MSEFEKTYNVQKAASLVEEDQSDSEDDEGALPRSVAAAVAAESAIDEAVAPPTPK